jgi:hypothetical protein
MAQYIWQWTYINIGYCLNILWRNMFGNSMFIHIECCINIWWRNVVGNIYIHVYKLLCKYFMAQWYFDFRHIYVGCCINTSVYICIVC